MNQDAQKLDQSNDIDRFLMLNDRLGQPIDMTNSHEGLVRFRPIPFHPYPNHHPDIGGTPPHPYTSFNQTVTNKLQMNLNPRYISKITNSPRKTQDPSLRMRPYFIPERSRTKSENSDAPAAQQYYDTIALIPNTNATMMDTSCDMNGFNNFMDSATNQMDSIGGWSTTTVTATHFHQPIAVCPMAITRLKKSKSLEDVRAKYIDGSQPSHEMEFMSNRIQNLRVKE